MISKKLATRSGAGSRKRSGKIFNFSASVLMTSLIGATISIPDAHALFPSPREGECDPAIFGEFVDKNIGPGSLKGTQLLEDPKLFDYIKDRDAAIVLGKALFWDMQVGSDGVQACGTCHFNAGADSRTKNQINPGGTDDETFDAGGPNTVVTADMFPFTKFSDTTDRFSPKLRSSDDVLSSQGVTFTEFKKVKRGASKDKVKNIHDPIFNVGGVNTRRVEPRNTPTMINAALFNKNFWDGRANNIFNGVSEFGAGDKDARILKATGNTLDHVKVRLDHSSLASQAVGPIVSIFEMSAANRARFQIGKRLMSARPLAQQNVHKEDSVLGSLARKNKGLKVKNYAKLVRNAFQPEWWDSDVIIRVNKDGTESFVNKDDDKDKLKKNEFTQMEYNFSLFFGLAVQEYEKTLISDDSKVDQHFDSLAAGGTGVLNEQELRGLALFDSNTACAACHSGPEFSSATFRTSRTGFINPEIDPPFQQPEQIERMFNGNCEVMVYEQGFYNIGVRPTEEDIGMAGTDPFGNPLSAAAIATADPATIPSPEILTFDIPNIADPPMQQGERITVQGAFKIPSLRNVALTAPYFHTGGMRTLREVVEFYNRGGDFHEHNDANMAFEIGKLGLTEQEIDDIVVFLHTLTDERVKYMRAPFDRPEISVPHGHDGDQFSVNSGDDDDDDDNKVAKAKDSLIHLPAVGKNGATPITSFLE